MVIEMKPMLVTLTDCKKCEAAKKYLEGINYDLITLSHDYKTWNAGVLRFLEEYDIIEDLKTTAPVFITKRGTKVIGQLRIKRWAYENK